MQTISVHINKGNTVTLCCPYCEFARIVNLDKLRGLDKTFVVHCKCKKQFKVNLNVRKSYRKSATLPGQFMILSPNTSTLLNLTVCDISKNGIGFTLKEPANINIGCTLRVKFNLDNHKQTLIDKKVIVMTVREDFIGCEFIELDLYQKELGFYLMP